MISDEWLHEIAQEAKVGRPLNLPRGIEIHSTQHGNMVTGRPCTIQPHAVDHYPNKRFVSQKGDVYAEELGCTVILWAGSGGYWKRLTILNDPDDPIEEHRFGA